MNTARALSPGPVRRAAQLTLGMAQLAPRGLSEDWWLRHLGDVHWQLIADAVGQNNTVFRDAKGRQIYAAFCATEFAQTRPERAGLGGAVALDSTLWAAGRSRLQSIHHLRCDGEEVARFRLISTFVTHEEPGVNASVCRANPYLLPVLPQAPDSFAQETSALARRQRAGAQIASARVTLHPCLGSDFNAVGLLYFPSYSRMFEQAEAQMTATRSWSPLRHRLVTYFSNIEAGDRVLATRADCESGSMTLWHDGPDGRCLAQSLCTRHSPSTV
ncbi:Pnap_2097 family protein [Dinoroseobacter sp. S76]|uniref:Pnap_2097 family protein n=1 Tax=Dinoroseobacter sp. S76 TaxID=3415124 RepID=UPI003C7AD5EC